MKTIKLIFACLLITLLSVNLFAAQKTYHFKFNLVSAGSGELSGMGFYAFTGPMGSPAGQVFLHFEQGNAAGPFISGSCCFNIIKYDDKSKRKSPRNKTLNHVTDLI